MTTQPNIPFDELPLWMRQARQEFDWGILIALAMSIAVAWTFLVHDELPAGHQLEHYVYQASDIVTAFEEGRLYPRWSPYAVKGYGAPIPHYYPVGASYTVALFEILFTNDLHQAVRLVFILTYAVAGISVYLWVSRCTDAAIGVLASLLYVYSPMIGSTIPYVMGELPLLMASGLLPLSLWSSYRLANHNKSFDLAITSFVMAVFLWIHPGMALLSILLNLSYILLDKFDTPRHKRLIRLIFATCVGVLLVSFFWLPAILEHDLVGWYATETLQDFSLSLNQLITPVQQIDSGLLMPQPQFKLGWMIIAFSIAGTITVAITKSESRRFHLLTLTLGCALVIFTLLFAPDNVWMLAPITLCFSIVGASILYSRQYLSKELSRLLLAFSIASTLIFSLPVWFVPPPHITMQDTDALSQIRFEQQGYGISTLQGGLPVPSTIGLDHSANRFLVNSYELHSPQRYEEQQNNANTVVSLLETATHRQAYRIYNAVPRELQFIIPYFEGWQAYTENTPIETYPHRESSMLTVEVPRLDNQELLISLTSTPVRHLSWIISLFALLILIGSIVFRDRSKHQEEVEMLQNMQKTDVRLMLFMFLCLTFIIAILTSDTPLIQVQNPPTFTLSQSLPLKSRTSAGFEAATFELNRRDYQLGDKVDITIYWQALANIPSNYKSRALLRDVTNRLVWSTGDLQSPGTVPSRRWIRNTFVPDQHFIDIPDDLITGEYQILIELFPCDRTTCNLNNPVIFFDINGNVIGDQLPIPVTINIR